ncbi:class I SAM-dependent methyltransferase [Paenibacillus athensensis]|uniref:16S rRNA methyltransferase n=1 Tax=Paenibacillus athensensis TaxID=1967502 RepID=A0A4Y8PV20_9BACL|nr:class I SAM-dependent methyltransferase [Paenibacillus athensensis]MCD1261942.1 class I SAM-dependent methyltransferase [Paenibacillus athensensis]
MSEHYYSQKPTAQHDVHEIQERLRGRLFTFQTDAGVFSKKGVDYGSRHLIETVELPPAAKVLDVGCGYGPMGLAVAAACPDGHVTMVDINERAVELARTNARRNGIANVRIVQSDLLEAVKEQRFDLIMTNPPIRAGKEVVHRIFAEAYACLQPGGSLWVVIQKKQGAPSAAAKLESIYGEVAEVSKDKGYRILRAIR